MVCFITHIFYHMFVRKPIVPHKSKNHEKSTISTIICRVSTMCPNFSPFQWFFSLTKKMSCFVMSLKHLTQKFPVMSCPKLMKHKNILSCHVVILITTKMSCPVQSTTQTVKFPSLFLPSMGPFLLLKIVLFEQ